MAPEGFLEKALRGLDGPGKLALFQREMDRNGGPPGGGGQFLAFFKPKWSVSRLNPVVDGVSAGKTSSENVKIL